MKANERYSSPIRNTDGSPMTQFNYTQEIRLTNKVNGFWKCQGWYSNSSEIIYDWTIPEDIILKLFEKV